MGTTGSSCFECKNHSLPGLEPDATYYFDLEGRLRRAPSASLSPRVGALPRHSREGPRAGTGAAPGGPLCRPLPSLRALRHLDGVCFTDYSALHRFFHERYLEVVQPYQIDERTETKRIQVADFCNARHPSATALLVQLHTPFQVRVALEHLAVNIRHERLSATDAVQRYELERGERTILSICQAVGACPEDVHVRIDEATERINARREAAAD